MYTHKYVPYIFLYLFVLRLLLIFFFFFFNDTATTEIYTLSLHDALPISYAEPCQLPPRCIPSVLLSFASAQRVQAQLLDRKSTRLNSSHGYISYAVFCLKKKKIKTQRIFIH